MLCVGSALLLSGCGAADEPLPGVAGEPSPAPGASLEVIDSDGETSGSSEPRVQAFATDESLLVVTIGSLSCPTIPEITDIDTKGRVVSLSLTPWDAELCTADLSPRTFDLPVGQDLNGYSVEVVPQ